MRALPLLMRFLPPSMRTPARRLATGLAASMLCLSATPAAQADEPASVSREHARTRQHVTPEQAYQLALEARTVRDYPAMLSFLRQAAEAGDIDAQDMLGSVLLVGSTLYGDAIPADPCEAAHWIRRATAQGSFVAWHLNIMLNNLRDRPELRQACASTRTD